MSPKPSSMSKNRKASEEIHGAEELDGVYRIPRGDLTNRDVYAAFGQDGYLVVQEALGRIPFDFSQWRDKRVLIKPNAGRRVGPNLGINTSPAAIAGVLDFFLKRGVTNLAVGDSSILGVTATETLEESGIAGAARERGVAVLDFDIPKPIVVTVPSPKVVRTLKVCRDVLESDIVVSVPVMKTHMHTQVSLGLKNMKGCLHKREKVRLHQLPPLKDATVGGRPLDMAIADLSKILLPDLTVIDGMIGQEGLGPSAGTSKPFGAMVASFNCLGADETAVRLMGQNPDEVNHIRLAFSELNSCRETRLHGLTQYKVFPNDYLRWSSEFEHPPKQISIEYENVRVEDVESCSACLSTVMMFLKRYQEELADYFNEDFPLKIAIGKGVGSQGDGTVLIGNCTIRHKTHCVFVRGCPPVASEIMKAIKNHRIIHDKP